MQENLQVFYG
jgi:hypothetical protein